MKNFSIIVISIALIILSYLYYVKVIESKDYQHNCKIIIESLQKESILIDEELKLKHTEDSKNILLQRKNKINKILNSFGVK